MAVRFEYDEAWMLKQSILLVGQPVRLQVAWWHDLLVIECEPMPAFVHLVRNVDFCIQEYGKYHISVAQWPVATQDDFNALYRAWNGVVVQLPIKYVSNEGYLELDDCPLVHDCSPIHYRPEAWYSDRALHISA